MAMEKGKKKQFIRLFQAAEKAAVAAAEASAGAKESRCVHVLSQLKFFPGAVSVLLSNNAVLYSDAVEERISRPKRKRRSISRMPNWITGIAKDPCDPVVDSLPESSKWKLHGNDEYWKQVLLVREALFFKRHVDSGAEQPLLQKNQKMQPSMYDDHVGSSHNLRKRLRCGKKLLPGQTSSEGQVCSPSSSAANQSDLDSCTERIRDDDSSTKCSVLDLPTEKKIPLKPDFQAKVPEWTGVVSESDSKWIGTRIWPPENPKPRFVIEKEPIGKGRQDSCGSSCQNLCQISQY